MDIISYILSKKYTDNTVDGLGGIKGAPCTVKSVVDIDGGKRITLEWESNSGVKQTQSFDIMDGEDGANTVEWSQIQQSGTKIAEININGVSTDVYAPTGGGGSANIVNCTQAEYDALPSSKESDDVLYVVYFDGGQVLDPDYSYYKYGDNDEIIVRVYHERESDQQILWFFNGWNQTSLDMPIPIELQVYKPSDTSPIYSDSYLTVGGAQTSWFGFYNNNFRSWDLSLGGQYTGIVHAVVNPFPSSIGQQINGYYSPYVYIQTSDQIRRIYMNGREYAEFNSGGGSELDAVETTSNDYALLPQADKDDPTKIYFLNDTQPSVADTPIDQSTFVSKVENQSQMNVAVTDGKLVSVYNYGSSIGACAFESNAISATASKIKFKFTTLGSYDTAQNHAITIGVKANYQSSDWIFPTDDDWLVKKVYDTRNTSVDDYIDISGITTPCYLMVCFHGWTVTFDEFLVEDVSVPTGDTEIKYKDISYGNNGGGSSWIDIQGTLLAGNTSVTLSNPSIKNTSNLEFFTDVFGICPTNVSVSSGSITLTFDAQANDLGVKVRVTNTGAASPYTFKSYLGVGNTAGAYINTGLNIATTQEFEVKFQLTDTQSNNVVYFGCWQSYKDTMVYYYGGGFGCGVGGTITPRHNFDTDIHVYKAMQDAIYLDDVQDGNANWANVPTNVPYYLFKDPDHSGAINIRIYYAKIWDNGTLIRDFIPAVRNDDGVIGMYDQVNDVFYTNDGAGSFITD